MTAPSSENCHVLLFRLLCPSIHNIGETYHSSFLPLCLKQGGTNVSSHHSSDHACHLLVQRCRSSRWQHETSQCCYLPIDVPSMLQRSRQIPIATCQYGHTPFNKPNSYILTGLQKTGIQFCSLHHSREIEPSCFS